jgi:hypothetical protein
LENYIKECVIVSALQVLFMTHQITLARNFHSILNTHPIKVEIINI